MICRACDSPDCGWMGHLGRTHWYACQSCGWQQVGPEPVYVDYNDDTETGDSAR